VGIIHYITSKVVLPKMILKQISAAATTGIVLAT